jgi:hypothetical protein
LKVEGLDPRNEYLKQAENEAMKGYTARNIKEDPYKKELDALSKSKYCSMKP